MTLTPFFAPTGSGASLGEDLWELHQHGADHHVHLLARNPLITERILSQLSPRRVTTHAPQTLPRKQTA